MEIRIKTAEEFHRDHVTIEIRADRAEMEEVAERVWMPIADVLAMNEKLAEAEAQRNSIGQELARHRNAHGCTYGCQPNAHVAFTGHQMVKDLQDKVAELEKSMAESRELVEFKTRVADENEEYLLQRIKGREAVAQEWRRKAEGWDHDRHMERDRADQNQAWAERAEANGAELSAAMVQAEKDRDSARNRVAELERQLAASIERENQAETHYAERAAEHQRSIAARENLLSAATTRIREARNILAAPGVVATRNEIVTSKGVILAGAIGNALAALGE